MSVFKIKYLTAPGISHVYCRLFVAPAPNMTYAGCGNFTVRAGEEFEQLQRVMSGIAFEPSEAMTDKSSDDSWPQAPQPPG